MIGKGMCQTIKCMLMNRPNIYCLFICSLVLFNMVLLSNPNGFDPNGIRIPVNIKGFLEHVVPSAPLTSNLLYATEECSDLKCLFLVCSCMRIDHILLNQFCTPWGCSSHWDPVSVPLSPATTLMQIPSAQGISRIIDFYFHVFM